MDKLEGKDTDRVDPYDASWRERVVVLGTVYLVLLGALWLGLQSAHDATIQMMGLAPGAIVAGKFLPLFALTEGSHFSAYQLGLVVWAADTFGGLHIVYALEALSKLRPLGRLIKRAQDNTAILVRAYPWMRRASILGVIFFVTLPLAGTGAPAGAFLGIFLGVHRGLLIAAVSLGGFLGGMAMAFLTVHFESTVRILGEWQSDPAIKYTVMIGGILLVVLLFWSLTRLFNRAVQRTRHSEAGAGLVETQDPR